MKKVLIILLVLVLVGAGAGGTIYFYLQNKNQIEANTSLQQQNAQIQAELNAIGQMTIVYEVNGDVESGKPILATDLKEVSVPTSTLGSRSIQDMNELVGKFYKINVSDGTILTKDLIMDQSSEGEEKYQLDIPVEYFPVRLLEGDYVDIRMLLPNGEIYVVMHHKRIQMVQEESKVLTFYVSEEEYWIWQSALIDYATYGNVGCTLYITKYLEPGKDTDTWSYYPVQEDVVSLIESNPNIDDMSRCVNANLRDHIDRVLFFASSSDNAFVSSAVKSIISQQATVVHEAYQEYIEKHTDEEGNYVPGNEGVAQGDASAGAVEGDASMSTDGTADFNQAVGDATEQLDQDLAGLGGF